MWWRKRRSSPHAQDEEGLRDAQRAVAASGRSLETTQKKTAEVDAIARKLRKLRETNHFSDAIVKMLKDQLQEHPNVGG